MNAVTTVPQHSFTELADMAQAVAASGLFGMKTRDQALALMMIAQAEGEHPATITQDYDIIQGKAVRKSNSVMSRFQKMGGTVTWHELTDAVADATFTHVSGGELRISWTLEMAKKAGLATKDVWKNYPRAMLRARLISEGIRAVFPAAIGGMLVVEEAQDLPIIERDITPKKAPQAAIASTPSAPEPRTKEQFEAALKKWAPHIIDGKKTADEIIAFANAKAPLTEAQTAQIHAIKAPLDATEEPLSDLNPQPNTEAAHAN